jgi:hypothetical protein
MIDKIFAPLALLLLTVFMAIIVFYVPKIELAIISVGCVGLAAYDFWRHFKGR